MTFFDEGLHQLDHLRDVTGGSRLIGRRTASQCFIRRMKLIFVVVRMGPPRGAGSSGLSEDLVVDIGDVGDNGHPVARTLQPAPQDVEDDLLADVAQMWTGLHRHSTVVNRHLALTKGLKGLDAMGSGVVELKRHMT